MILNYKFNDVKVDYLYNYIYYPANKYWKIAQWKSGREHAFLKNHVECDSYSNSMRPDDEADGGSIPPLPIFMITEGSSMVEHM